MKRLNLLLLFCISIVFIACTSKEENSIVGVWQQTSHQGLPIEFDKDGFYHLLKANERITSGDSTVLKYSYNPETNKEFNFTLGDGMSDFKYKGNITFNNPDNIHISFKGTNNQLNVQREYTRVNLLR